MNQKGFLRQLSRRLKGIPAQEKEASLAYYTEMIQDHMEAGLSEAEAVAQLGGVDEIAAQILAESPGRDEAREKKGKQVWLIVLLALGSPVWLSALVTAAVVALSLLVVILAVYIVVWSLLVSVWTVELSLAVCGPAGMLGLGMGLAKGNISQGMAVLAVGFAALGLALVLLPLLVRMTKGLARFSGWSIPAMFRIFKRRRAA